MNDYGLERKILYDWLLSENERINKDVPLSGGQDGEYSVQQKELTKEYNRKLIELKTKYGVT